MIRVHALYNKSKKKCLRRHPHRVTDILLQVHTVYYLLCAMLMLDAIVMAAIFFALTRAIEGKIDATRRCGRIADTERTVDVFVENRVCGTWQTVPVWYTAFW